MVKISKIYKNFFLESLLIFSLFIINPFNGISVVDGKNLITKSHSDSFLRGISFTGFSENAFLTEFSNQSLERFAEDGGEWIAICFWWFIDDLSSSTIYPDFDWYSCSNESIIAAIMKAKELGLKVMLKPMVDPKEGGWRAYIKPTIDWFNSYKSFIVSWGKFAQNLNVEMLCIGCEFSLTESNSSNWMDIINGPLGIRTVYSGELTYAANYDSYNLVDWWDSVDYIGVDAYYDLTNSNKPTLEQLIGRWDELKAELNETSEIWGEKIIFTEIGYRSIDGANRWPWDWERNGILDLEEQRLCYEALFRSLWGEEWFQGIFWWDWTPEDIGNWLSDKSYMCQYKPAEEVLKAWYSVDFGIEPTYTYSISLKNWAAIYLISIVIVMKILSRVFTQINMREKKK